MPGCLMPFHPDLLATDSFIPYDALRMLEADHLRHHKVVGRAS